MNHPVYFNKGIVLGEIAPAVSLVRPTRLKYEGDLVATAKEQNFTNTDQAVSGYLKGVCQVSSNFAVALLILVGG